MDEEFPQEVKMMNTGIRVREKWIFSEEFGSSTPNEARKVSNDHTFILGDAELVKCMRKFIETYPGTVIDLKKIIAVGGEGTA